MPIRRPASFTPLRRLLALAIGLGTLGSAAAQSVELSLPLDGYTRLGRATALHISGEGLSASRLTVSGPGVISVQVPAVAGRVEATVPLLTQGTPPESIQWSSGQASGKVAMTSRLLGTDERLIAVAADDSDVKTLADSLFPGKKSVQVRLDTARPRLLWPPQAFDAVDAVLLDLPSAARVDEEQLRVMLAAGTTVAIRSPSRPVGQWPWTQQGSWWVLRHTPVGPHGGVNVDAYDPTYAWDRSWPAPQRQTVLTVSILAALVLAGASLVRGKWGFVAAMTVCVIATTGAFFYAISLQPAVRAGGDVVVWDGALGQRDRWTYVSAFRDAHCFVEATDRTRPVLGSRRQIESLGLTLACDATGAPDRFNFALGGKQTIAFVSRSVSPLPPASTGAETRTDLADVRMDLIADKLYPGRVSDQTTRAPSDAVGEWWGAVVMRP